jgi:hypothetical protein
MYSPATYGALVNSRIEELHRDAGPVMSPRFAGAVRHQVHRCTSALAAYFRSAMPGAPVENRRDTF